MNFFKYFQHYAKTELGIGYQQNSYKQHFR
jgi:hypothetical protein